MYIEARGYPEDGISCHIGLSWSLLVLRRKSLGIGLSISLTVPVALISYSPFATYPTEQHLIILGTEVTQSDLSLEDPSCTCVQAPLEGHA